MRGLRGRLLIVDDDIPVIAGDRTVNAKRV